MVKCLLMIVKWVYNHTLISQSLTSFLPSLAWSKSSVAHLTIIEKLHRLPFRKREGGLFAPWRSDRGEWGGGGGRDISPLGSGRVAISVTAKSQRLMVFWGWGHPPSAQACENKTVGLTPPPPHPREGGLQYTLLEKLTEEECRVITLIEDLRA